MQRAGPAEDHPPAGGHRVPEGRRLRRLPVRRVRVGGLPPVLAGLGAHLPVPLDAGPDGHGVQRRPGLRRRPVPGRPVAALSQVHPDAGDVPVHGHERADPGGDGVRRDVRLRALPVSAGPASGLRQVLVGGRADLPVHAQLDLGGLLCICCLLCFRGLEFESYLLRWIGDYTSGRGTLVFVLLLGDLPIYVLYPKTISRGFLWTTIRCRQSD